MIMLLQYVMADLEVQVRDVVFKKKTTSLTSFCGVPKRHLPCTHLNIFEYLGHSILEF